MIRKSSLRRGSAFSALLVISAVILGIIGGFVFACYFDLEKDPIWGISEIGNIVSANKSSSTGGPQPQVVQKQSTTKQTTKKGDVSNFILTDFEYMRKQTHQYFRIIKKIGMTSTTTILAEQVREDDKRIWIREIQATLSYPVDKTEVKDRIRLTREEVKQQIINDHLAEICKVRDITFKLPSTFELPKARNSDKVDPYCSARVIDLVSFLVMNDIMDLAKSLTDAAVAGIPDFQKTAHENAAANAIDDLLYYMQVKNIPECKRVLDFVDTRFKDTTAYKETIDSEFRSVMKTVEMLATSSPKNTNTKTQPTNKQQPANNTTAQNTTNTNTNKTNPPYNQNPTNSNQQNPVNPDNNKTQPDNTTANNGGNHTQNPDNQNPPTNYDDNPKVKKARELYEQAVKICNEADGYMNDSRSTSDFKRAQDLNSKALNLYLQARDILNQVQEIYDGAGVEEPSQVSVKLQEVYANVFFCKKRKVSK